VSSSSNGSLAHDICRASSIASCDSNVTCVNHTSQHARLSKYQTISQARRSNQAKRGDPLPLWRGSMIGGVQLRAAPTRQCLFFGHTNTIFCSNAIFQPILVDLPTPAGCRNLCMAVGVDDRLLRATVEFFVAQTRCFHPLLRRQYFLCQSCCRTTRIGLEQLRHLFSRRVASKSKF
jgi:hypothetical protein